MAGSPDNDGPDVPVGALLLMLALMALAVLVVCVQAARQLGWVAHG